MLIPGHTSICISFCDRQPTGACYDLRNSCEDVDEDEIRQTIISHLANCGWQVKVGRFTFVGDDDYADYCADITVIEPVLGCQFLV